MARAINKLIALTVTRLKEPGAILMAAASTSSWTGEARNAGRFYDVNIPVADTRYARHLERLKTEAAKLSKE